MNLGKAALILNPRAGSVSRRKANEAIRSFASANNIALFATEYKGHAAELTRSLQNEFETIIAAGGDGTINEIAGELANSKTKLGIVPMGSGNGLAHHLKIPLGIDEALETLKGSAKPIDLIRINDKIIANVGGAGFDGHISQLFNKSKNRGSLAYAKLIITELYRFKDFEYSLALENKSITGKAFIIAICNGSEFGNRLIIDPEANTQDSILSIIIVKRPPLRLLPGLLIDAYSGKLQPNPYYQRYSGSEVLLKTDDTPLHRDGEVDSDLPAQPLKISIMPQALNVIF